MAKTEQGTVHLEGRLKLRHAESVEELPGERRGRKSVLNDLEEFKDVQDIVALVKRENAPPAEKWKVFDLAKVTKRHPELRKMKGLVRNFAIKVRDLMKKQGVVGLVDLKMRENAVYLVGKPVRRAQ
jgi:hypothetical protein